MRVHISLQVDSLAKSIDFYSGLFGQDASKTRPQYANFRLDEPPIHLALMEAESEPGHGVSHLGIELPDAGMLADWKSRLETDGTRFEVEDQARCCYAQADKLWLTDPDGYRWELWVRTGEHESMGETRVSAFSDEAEACCA
jgi:catechol 2,3-dioxygenase-like lactoylglutathione lyase family enzyme